VGPKIHGIPRDGRRRHDKRSLFSFYPQELLKTPVFLFELPKVAQGILKREKVLLERFIFFDEICLRL
jgi:hypothetical protein